MPLHPAPPLPRPPPRRPPVSCAACAFGSTAPPRSANDADADRVDWLRVLPFVLLHAGCAGVIWVGVSPVALLVAGVLYVVRMFAITGFYHRYFSHRSFRTSRGLQFVFALIGAASVQRGPLWWAAHHRHHHRHADQARDLHSPRHGFWRDHMGWFMTPRAFATDLSRVRTGPPPGDCAGWTATTWRYPWPWPSPCTPPARCCSTCGRRWTPAARSCWCGVLHLHRRAVPCHGDDQFALTASAAAASRPPTTAATISCWRCSPSARAGTTTIISTPAAPAGLPLVGSGRDLVRPAPARPAGPGARPQAGARTVAGTAGALR